MIVDGPPPTVQLMRKCHIRYQITTAHQLCNSWGSAISGIRLQLPTNCATLYEEVPHQVSDYNRQTNCATLYEEVPYQVSDYNRQPTVQLYLYEEVPYQISDYNRQPTVQLHMRKYHIRYQITTAHATVQLWMRKYHGNWPLIFILTFGFP